MTSLTFTIITEGHLGLAQANGVFSGADAIECLEFGLLDILEPMHTSSATNGSWEIRSCGCLIKFVCDIGRPTGGDKSQWQE